MAQRVSGGVHRRVAIQGDRLPVSPGWVPEVGNMHEDIVAPGGLARGKIPGGRTVAARHVPVAVVARPPICVVHCPAAGGLGVIHIAIVHGDGAGFVLGHGRGGERSAGGKDIAVGNTGVM